MSFTLTVSGLILRLTVVPETDEIDEIKVFFLGRCHIITFPTVCSTVVGGCHSVGVLFLFSTSWVSCCVQTPFVIHTYLRTGSFVPSMLICREAADVATVQMLAVCYLATATICVWECACVLVFRSASAWSQNSPTSPSVSLCVFVVQIHDDSGRLWIFYTTLNFLLNLMPAHLFLQYIAHAILSFGTAWYTVPVQTWKHIKRTLSIPDTSHHKLIS